MQPIVGRTYRARVLPLREMRGLGRGRTGSRWNGDSAHIVASPNGSAPQPLQIRMITTITMIGDTSIAAMPIRTGGIIRRSGPRMGSVRLKITEYTLATGVPGVMRTHDMIIRARTTSQNRFRMRQM